MSWHSVSDAYCSVHGLTTHMNGFCCECTDIEMKKLKNMPKEEPPTESIFTVMKEKLDKYRKEHPE